ncbi:hypothetical protein BDN70DRAFT_873691 [Pholiota conissans]|uniref:Uncharacterized protein n=1 Tax=Pholiota conissans TaxID=109636 RepID=A0A9P5ZBS3_9AGAR|nr:hypothetical protein BDN70DRAFT_873691 [Pholiota conissans]
MSSMENLSLSFPQATRAHAAEAIVNDQPQAGIVQTYAEGVSMPGNANDQRKTPLRIRGGSTAQNCYLDICDWMFPCECCGPFVDCTEDYFCACCRAAGC